MEGKKLFCTQCGKQIESSEKFCSACGKPVNKNGSNENHKQTNVVQPNTDQKKANKKTAVSIIAVLLVSLGLYLLFSNTDFKEIAGSWIFSDEDSQNFILEIEKDGKACLTTTTEAYSSDFGDEDDYYDEDEYYDDEEEPDYFSYDIAMHFQVEKIPDKKRNFTLMNPEKVEYIMDKEDYVKYVNSEYEIEDLLYLGEGASDIMTVTHKDTNVFLTFEDPEYLMDNHGNGVGVVLKSVNKDTITIDGDTLIRQ